MYLSLSWRNIWRNKKRTLISVASVFFAVFFALLMRSAQHGSYSYMIHSSAKLFTGYLQIQGKGFWENRSLDKSISINQKQQNELNSIEHITNVTPRLEAFALISYEITTKVAQVVGINPKTEDSMTGLNKKLVKGTYLTSESNEALVAEGLAGLLKVEIGDSIIIYGQGYHGQVAAACVAVCGFVKMPFQEMNNGMVFLSLNNAQNVFSAYDRITSLPIMIDNINNLEEVQTSIKNKFDGNTSIMSWDEMMPDLVQSIQMDNAAGIIMLGILYMVISFGVFGTVMMMVSERTKEFGILISVGMKRGKIIWITTLETIFLSFLGVVAGSIGCFPLIYHLHNNPLRITGDATKTFDQLGIEPIFNFSIEPEIFMTQSFIVLLIAIATIIYPVIFIRRLKPINAIRA